MSSIDSTYYIFVPLSLVALKRKILQKNVKNVPIMEKSAPIRTCVDSKYTSTGFRSNLPSSIDFNSQFLIWSFSSSQNRQKPSKITTNYGETWIDSYLCRFQINHCWFQVESVNLSLKSAMAGLKSTQVQIDSDFLVICSGF